MANLNHTGAFATVEPIKGDTSEWIHKNNKPFFDNIEKEKANKIAKDKQKSDLYGKIDKFEIPEGFKINSLQEILNDNLPTLMSQAREFTIEAEQAAERGDVAGVYRANQKIKNLNNLGSVIKTSLTASEKEGLDMQEGFKSGKLLPTEENLQKMASFRYDKVKIMANSETGDIMYAFQDINQDGVIDEKDGQSYLEWINHNDFNNSPFGNKVSSFDIDKHARDIGNSLEPEFIETINGYIKTGKTQEVDSMLNDFWLDQKQLESMRVLDPGKTDEQYNQYYRNRIKNYIKEKEEKQFLGSKYSTNYGGYKKETKPKELTYISTSQEGTHNFSFKEKAGGELGIRLKSAHYNPETDKIAIVYDERKKLPEDIERQLQGMSDEERRMRLLIISPKTIDQYETNLTDNEEEVYRILGSYLNKNDARDIIEHLEGLANKKGIRKKKEIKHVEVSPAEHIKTSSKKEEKKEKGFGETFKNWFSGSKTDEDGLPK